MEMRVFGRTGMQLSVLGFGCGAVAVTTRRTRSLVRAATRIRWRAAVIATRGRPRNHHIIRKTRRLIGLLVDS